MNLAELKVQQTFSTSVKGNQKIGNLILHSIQKLKQYSWKGQELLYMVCFVVVYFNVYHITNLFSFTEGLERRRSQLQVCCGMNLVCQFALQDVILFFNFQLHDRGTLKKSNSCSTIFVDESTVCQPNLKNTIKCVTLAIYYHIKNRQSERQMDIFDEKLHPLSVSAVFPFKFGSVNDASILCILQKDGVSNDYSRYNPDHRQVYKFVRTLFNAAQLTAECAIITLIYLERLENILMIHYTIFN